MHLMPARHTDRRLQCSISPVDHLQGTATVSDDATGWSHAAGRAWCGRTIKHGTLDTSSRSSLAILSHKNPSTIIGFQPPRDHLSAPRAQCNCPILSYKRTGQTSISDDLTFTQVQLSLEQCHTYNNTTLSLWT
jgi:hypothetical protein